MGPQETNHETTHLADLEPKEVDLRCRTVYLALSVQCFSELNAVEIGHGVLKLMKAENIIGPTDGDVVMGL